MISVKTEFVYDEDQTLTRPFLIIESHTGQARASAKTRELADKALALLDPA